MQVQVSINDDGVLAPLMAQPEDGAGAVDVPRFVLIASNGFTGGFGHGPSLKVAAENAEKAMGKAQFKKAKKRAYLIPDGIREVFLDDMGGLNWKTLDGVDENIRPVKLGEVL